MLQKILFILLLSFIFSLNVNYPFTTYIAKPFEKLHLNESKACACFKLSENLQKGDTFYLEVFSDEIEAKINKTLYYNFTDSCNQNECNENSYLYSSKKEKPYSDIEENGFFYEYEFLVNDTNITFLKVQYIDFVGNKFSMQYIPINVGDFLRFSFLLFFLIIIIAVIIIIYCICKCFCRKKSPNLNPELNNAVSSPIVQQENILNPKSEQYIELRKY